MPGNIDSSPAELFYTDLVAELYEPLAGGLPVVEPYQRFLDRYGGPALELGCGTGIPLLELLTLGYDVEGLDASADMLALCRRKAEFQNLAPVLHEGLFQSFQLNKKFRSIYVPSASFTLLTNDEDALATLVRIYEHLESGGAVYIPLEVFDADDIKIATNEFRETRDSEGNLLRVGVTAVSRTEQNRNMVLTLRYEKHLLTGEVQIVERDWLRRCWNVEQITGLLVKAGFSPVKIIPTELVEPRRAFTVIAESSR